MIYRFNQCTLDTERYQLNLQDKPVSIEPLVFDLLVYLVENRDRVVSREELLDKLWEGKVVTDSALGARLKDARKAVQDNGSKQAVIKTFHSRGYQFVAQVMEVSSEETNYKNETSETATDLNLQEKPSIVVLPFTNMSEDPEQEYFSDGITEDIITELSRFDVLNMIARHSSLALKHEKLGHMEIADKLSVQYIVEGSVRRARNRIRVTAQLIDADTGNHVWAERYDRELEDIFAVQDELTQSIVGVLPQQVLENVAVRASRKPPGSLKAYELMLKGKVVRDSFSAEAMAQARSLFEQAIKIDPIYARPYMLLSDTYLVDFMLGIEQEDTTRKMVELAQKAISLDSREITNQLHLGYAYIVEGLWEDAERQFDKTLLRIVNEAEQTLWCGFGLLWIGQAERARDITLEAMQMDPLHQSSYDWVLGQVYFFLQSYEDVVQTFSREALLNSLAHGFLAGAYAHLGRMDEARDALDLFVQERHRELASRNLIIESDTITALAGSYRKHWKLETYWEAYSGGLRKAGLHD